MAWDISEEQLKVLRALAKGRTRVEAASEAGCSERTVYNYLRQPEFVAALEEARREFWGAFLASLKAEAYNAVRLLGEVLAGRAVTPSQLKAAQTLVSSALNTARHAEVEEIRAELNRLKAELGLAVAA